MVGTEGRAVGVGFVIDDACPELPVGVAGAAGRGAGCVIGGAAAGRDSGHGGVGMSAAGRGGATTAVGIGAIGAATGTGSAVGAAFDAGVTGRADCTSGGGTKSGSLGPS